MSLIVEYAVERTFTQTLEVEDQGNTCIKATGDVKDVGPANFYMFIRTIAGTTTTLTIGPITPDFALLINGFKVEAKQFKYNEKRIKKEINNFLNGNCVGEACEIATEEGLADFPDIITMFENL